MAAPNMEAPGEVGTEGRAQGTVAEPDFATADEWRAAVAQRDKEHRTLIAQFAIAGWALYITETCGRPSYVVTRWGQVREFDTLAEVEAFARRVGVQV
jgi:hypothetical protein